MKEHPGGKPSVAVEFREDVSFPVPITVFRPEEWLDRPEDLVREAIALGRPLGPILDLLMEEREAAVKAEVVNGVLGFVIGAERPRLAAYGLAFTCQLAVVQNLSPAEVARRCGCSKQNVYQMIERACQELGLRKCAWMRDGEARERMRERNYRRQAPGGAATDKKGEVGK